MRAERRAALLALLLPSFLLACSRQQQQVARPASASSQKPCIFLVVIDTARADHFSFLGYDRRTTPFIDRLAKDAVVYRNAHSVAPWTLPAHMSMFTGLLPGEHGATWAAFSQPASVSLAQMLSRSPRLCAPSRMLAARLKATGYNTLGISENPWISRSLGFGFGFDHFLEAWTKVGCDVTPRDPKSVALPRGNSAGCSFLMFEERFASKGLEAPFFVFFNLADPHLPYDAPEGFTFKFANRRDVAGVSRVHDELLAGQPGAVEKQLLAGTRRIQPKPLAALYDGELNYVDSVVGQLVDWLRAKKLYRRSLVVVTSDHGEHLGEGGRYSHQLSMEEALLRIPLIVKYPGNRGAGTVEESPLVSNLDIYRTLLAAADADGGPGLDSGWSRNLAERERFDRRILPAEYQQSDAYLRELATINSAFDVAAHRKVQRVFYAGTGKYFFEDSDFVKREESGGSPRSSDAADRDTLVQQMRDFIRHLDAGCATGTTERNGAAPEPQTIEALRALGYIS